MMKSVFGKQMFVIVLMEYGELITSAEDATTTVLTGMMTILCVHHLAVARTIVMRGSVFQILIVQERGGDV